MSDQLGDTIRTHLRDRGHCPSRDAFVCDPWEVLDVAHALTRRCHHLADSLAYDDAFGLLDDDDRFRLADGLARATAAVAALNGDDPTELHDAYMAAARHRYADV